jgi:hypothetical protein
LRHTVLTIVAFNDLDAQIRGCDGDREQGIKAFLSQNGGYGWELPGEICLADYGLGDGDPANVAQPVASRLGPSFYEWQLAQEPEESWRECHLHARNLLGAAGYARLLEEIATGRNGRELPKAAESRPPDGGADPQGDLFA